jgi:hypothetical protein
MSSELFSSHAAHCDYISPGSDLIICHYASQYVLASAAKKALENEEILICCIKELTSILRLGLDSRGSAGDLTSKIIFSCAMCKALRISIYSKEDAGGILHRGLV